MPIMEEANTGTFRIVQHLALVIYSDGYGL